ncbi:MAG: diacylglyceryl transferase [Pseudonocardiaceae bacterium]|nr:diacylglyceryl transferase [Pseudonocardiaceae bacterium]
MFHVWGFAVPTHEFFVFLGVAVAAAVFFREARQRGQLSWQTLAVVAGALVGGAIGMRLSGWFRYLDPMLNPSLLEAWRFGTHSILGGLALAYVGVHVAKKLIGYRVRTGDLFAPAVALGMAVGRIGCLLTEAPGRPTELPWGVHAPGSVPNCPGCAAGAPMHPSFVYEIMFHLAAFAALYWLKPRLRHRSGALFTVYVAGYAVFRFAVEFTRANETVWLELTRPQWFLTAGILLAVARAVLYYRTRAGRDATTHERAREETVT